MPRNLDEYVYLSVPIRKGSSLHAHLKEEVQRLRGNKCAQVGPYVSALLEERDRHLYASGEVQEPWFSSHPACLTQQIETAMQKAIASVLPSLFASLPLMATQTQPALTSIAENSEEAIEQEAAAMAASLKSGGWGCEDEEEE